MVWYDFVILAILIYGAWQGAARGLVMQLAWIVAIVLCFEFADKLAPQIEFHIGVEPRLRHWIAMLILYLGFSLASFLAARWLSNVIEKAKLRDFDRHLGGLFGLLKGAVLSLVLTFFAVTLSESLQETVVRSQTGFIACKILDTIRPLTPEDAHPLIHESLTKYQEALDDGENERLGQQTSLDKILNVIGGDDGAIDLLNDGGDVHRFPAGSESDSSGSLYNGLLELVPESMRDQWRKSSLRDRWNRMPSENRERWMDDLRISSSSAQAGILGDLIDVLDGEGSERRGYRAAESADGQGLVDKIAAEYRDHKDPDLMAIRINQYLADLPERIQLAVLEDWYVDLTGHGRDPDLMTDSDTRIDDRILSQLDKAGLSLDNDSALRSRLQRSRR